ncbi:hypothetical protein [Xanthomonas sp. 60]
MNVARCPHEEKAALDAVLKGTPQEIFIPALLSNLRNADGFPVGEFTALAVRARATTPASAWPAVKERLHQAVVDRQRNGGFDPPLHRPLADALLGGIPWSAVHGAASACFGPQARLATLVAQMASSVLPHLARGRWPAALAALQLVPWQALLPPLRSIAQIDQLVSALPETLRDLIASSHQTLSELEQGCTPHSLPACAALAIATGLWALYGAAGDVDGDHAQRLLRLPQSFMHALRANAQLGAAFATPEPPVVADQALKDRYVAFQAIKQFLDDARAAGQRDEVTITGLIECAEATRGQATPVARAYAEVSRLLQSRLAGPDAGTPVCQSLSNDMGDHLAELLQRLGGQAPVQGSALVADPTTCAVLFQGLPPDPASEPAPAEASGAASPASLWRSCAATVTHALGSIGNLRRSGTRPPEELPAVQPQRAAASPAATRDTAVTAALLPTLAVAAAQQQGVARQGSLAGAIGGAVALMVGAGALAAVRSAWAGTKDTTAPVEQATDDPTPAALRDLQQRESTIVALPDGSWASQWDVEHTPPPSVTSHHRSRRHASAPQVVQTQATGEIEDTCVISRHAVEEALLSSFAKRPAYAWLSALTSAEQRLWLTQHIELERLHAVQVQQHPGATAQLEASLRAGGWTGPWDDLRVEVPGAHIDGQPYREQLPLLEYCLYRPGHAGLRLFSRNGMPLTADEERTLTAVIESPACRDLPGATTRAPVVDSVMVDKVKARFKRAALESKARGQLGSGGQSYLRGAEIVLGFINGDPHIEQGALVYEGLAADGLRLPAGVAPDAFRLPGYLVLRSGHSDPDSHRRGQIVVYRASDRSMNTFADDYAFHSFINARRGGQELAVREDLRADVLAAAPPGSRSLLRTAQSGAPYPGRPPEWSRQDHLQFDFDPPPAAGHRFDHWARQAATQDALHAAAVARDLHAQGAAQWTPIGRQAARATQAVAAAQSALSSWEDVARPMSLDVFNTFHERATGQAGLLGPQHRVMLGFGGKYEDLAWWATHGWKQHGPQDGTGRIFPDRTVIEGMQVEVFSTTASGALEPDATTTALLNTPLYLTQLCYGMRALVGEGRPLAAYRTYLARFRTQPEGLTLQRAMADSLRWRTRALIERATAADGNLQPEKRAALLDAYARLDGAEPSLSVVTLGGVAVEGLWALRTAQEPYVIVLSGPNGDQLMDTAQFQAFIADDYDRAESFLQRRAAFDTHADLAGILTRRRASVGIDVGCQGRHTPAAAAGQWLQKLEANAVALATQGDMTLEEWLTVGAGLATMGVCTLATGGLGTALCTVASAGWVLQGFRDGTEALERGELGRALGELLGAGAGTLGLLGPSGIARMLFHANRRVVSNMLDAAEMLLDVGAQAASFDVHGVLVSSAGLLGHLPAITRRGRDGATEVIQDGRTFVATADGGFAETIVDEHGVRRVAHAQRAGAPGAPVTYSAGKWRRQDAVPEHWHLRTTPPTAALPVTVADVPAYALLDAADQTRLSAAFGLGSGKVHSIPDLAGRVEEAMIATRIRQMTEDPGSIGLPTDMPAVLTAWCRSPRLGQQQGLQVYTASTRNQGGAIGPVFGYADIGVSIAVPPGHGLPSLEKVVETVGVSKVASQLGLPPDSAWDPVMTAVRHELAAQFAADQGQAARGWRRWQAHHADPLHPPADALQQQYPALTRREARHLVQQDPGVAQAARAGQFNTRTDGLVSELLAQRNARKVREDLLDGRADSLAHLTTLQTQLGELMPYVRWSIRGEPGRGQILHYVHDGRTRECMRIDEAGTMYPPGSATACTSWQACIHPRLPDAARQAIPAPATLRQHVAEQLSVTALGRSCIVRSITSGRRKKRTPVDLPCPAPVKQPPTDPVLISASEDVLAQHRTTTADIWKKVDSGALNLDRKTRTALSNANFASWKTEGMQVNGVAIQLPPGIAQGSTVSGSFRLDGMLPGAPLTTLLVPVEGGAATSGVLRGVMPEHYAFGADGIARTEGTRGDLVEVTQAALDMPIGKSRKKITEMTDTELAKVQPNQVPEPLRVFFGAGKPVLMQKNLEKLKPGTYRAYDVRSCAEGKFLDGLLDALATHSSSAREMRSSDGYARLQSGALRPDPDVRGRIALFTDMDPCQTSCDRRLRALQNLFPNLQIRVQSAFADQRARIDAQAQWRQSYIEAMRGQWQQARKTDAEMTELATQAWYAHQYDHPPRTWDATGHSTNVYE